MDFCCLNEANWWDEVRCCIYDASVINYGSKYYDLTVALEEQQYFTNSTAPSI